jgi:site-specific DNA-adenine methylase
MYGRPVNEVTVYRYSGSKQRLLKHLPAPPLGTSTVIEPFAGSLAFSVHYRASTIWAAEANPQVNRLLSWLREEATDADLAKVESVKPTEKVDARTWAEKHGLNDAQTTLLRLQISGAYVGQLSSWVLYPQHQLKLTALRKSLPALKRALQPVAHDFRDEALVKASAVPRTMAFVDPPYLGTAGNYKSPGADHWTIDANAITLFVNTLKCPVLFTYGDGAKETFPSFTWHKAVTRRVPILRGGGTRERTEWFAQINW